MYRSGNRVKPISEVQLKTLTSVVPSQTRYESTKEINETEIIDC